MAEIKYNHGLNRRQFALYDYLKSRGDVWTSQFSICSALREFYEIDEDVAFHDCNARKILTADIAALNDSDYIPKPILSGARGNKIANEDEWNSYISRLIMADIRRLNRHKKMSKKASKDGQFKIVFNGKERDIVQAFISDLYENV